MFLDKVPLTPSDAPTMFRWNNENTLGEKWISIEIATILWNLKQLGQNFALHSRTTQSISIQTIIGISVTMRTLEPAQRFKHTFWILRWGRRFQTYPKYIGPTLHVEPNEKNTNRNSIY